MDNNRLFKYTQDNTLTIVFKGAFFDKPIPSTIIENQLAAFRRYSKENNLDGGEGILIRIERGSYKIEFVNGTVILVAVLGLLSTDFGQIKKNYNFLKSSTVFVIKSLLVPISEHDDSTITFNEGIKRKEIRKINSKEAVELLKLLPDQPPTERRKLEGVIFGIRKDSKFSFKIDEQSEEIKLSFIDSLFKDDPESIRKQFDLRVRVEGLANINKDGIITSMRVEKYDSIPNPQQKLSLD